MLNKGCYNVAAGGKLAILAQNSLLLLTVTGGSAAKSSPGLKVDWHQVGLQKSRHFQSWKLSMRINGNLWELTGAN